MTETALDNREIAIVHWNHRAQGLSQEDGACKHKGKIHYGGDLSWCDECGICVWSIDGPRAEHGPNQWKQWIAENVHAFGCTRETDGGSCCAQWCGSSVCIAILRRLGGQTT